MFKNDLYFIIIFFHSYIRLAEQGFLKPRWATAYLKVSDGIMLISWYYNLNGQYYKISFANKRADKQLLDNFDVT